MSAEPVVLLHCSGSSGAQWRSLARKLAPRYRAFAPDLIGYGEGEAWLGRGEFGLAHEAEAVRDLLRELAGPAHLVGHSYGAGIALHLARTSPELLSSLTLIEPTAFHLLRNGDAIETAALRELTATANGIRADLLRGDYHGGFGRFVDYWNGAGTWAQMPLEKRAGFARLLPKIALEFHALINEPAGIEDVAAIGLPTLIVQGGCTLLPPRCVCARLDAALPNARLKVVRSAGHMLPITHREEANALVAAHIDANSDQREIANDGYETKDRLAVADVFAHGGRLRELASA